MVDSSPHLYWAQGRALGFTDNVLDRGLARMAASEGRGLGPILSLNHLAHLSGVSYLYLRNIVQRRVDPYADVVISKRTGGMRYISAPEPILMDVQRLILRRALSSLDLHPRTYAYRRGRSIVNCAQHHVGARWLIKFDLHNFFDTIFEKRVYRVFLEQGYSELVAFELARLCTRSTLHTFPDRDVMKRYPVIPSYAIGSQGRLPQGAPTSGALANAVATPLDRELFEFATQTHLVYTRYSDDLTFSADERFTRANAAPVIRQVGAIVQRNSFVLHHKKTRIVPPGARHVVLGLLVDSTEVRLLPEFRRRVEVHVRGVTKFGLAPHAAVRRFRSILSFVNYMDGCLAFAEGVEPDWAEKTRGAWRQGLVESGFPLEV